MQISEGNIRASRPSYYRRSKDWALSKKTLEQIAFSVAFEVL